MENIIQYPFTFALVIMLHTGWWWCCWWWSIDDILFEEKKSNWFECRCQIKSHLFLYLDRMNRIICVELSTFFPFSIMCCDDVKRERERKKRVKYQSNISTPKDERQPRCKERNKKTDRKTFEPNKLRFLSHFTRIPIAHTHTHIFFGRTCASAWANVSFQIGRLSVPLLVCIVWCGLGLFVPCWYVFWVQFLFAFLSLHVVYVLFLLLLFFCSCHWCCCIFIVCATVVTIEHKSNFQHRRTRLHDWLCFSLLSSSFSRSLYVPKYSSEWINGYLLHFFSLLHHNTIILWTHFCWCWSAVVVFHSSFHSTQNEMMHLRLRTSVIVR